MVEHKIVTSSARQEIQIFFFPVTGAEIGHCVPLCGLQCLEIGWNMGFWGIWHEQDVELASV